MTEGICMGCGWKSVGGSCIVWKYVTPEICRQFKKEIDEFPIRTYQSPALEFTCVIRVLCGFDYSVDPKITPTGTYYIYSKITSEMRSGVWVRKSRESITKKEYEDFIKEKQKSAM